MLLSCASEINSSFKNKISGKIILLVIHTRKAGVRAWNL